MTVDGPLMAEVKLKAWCEGSIDDTSTQAHMCDGGSRPYDYTFEALKFDAFSGHEFGAGHGPMVNTRIKASHFNELAAAIDLLNKFRVEGLMQFEARSTSYATTITVPPMWGSGACPPGPSIAAWWEGQPSQPAQTVVGEWGPVGTFTARSDAELTMCAPGGTTNQELGLISTSNSIDYRYVPTPGFENAIPATVQGLIDNNFIGVWGTIYQQISIPKRRVTAIVAEPIAASAAARAHFGMGFERASLLR